METNDISDKQQSYDEEICQLRKEYIQKQKAIKPGDKTCHYQFTNLSIVVSCFLKIFVDNTRLVAMIGIQEFH